MATEKPLPYDLHDSNDLGRFTHVAPSTLTDSEHEVLVEADSDSDVPSLKARKDRSSASLPINGRKMGLSGKMKPLPSEPHTNPLMSEDLLYHLMDQNKILMDQNKVLTQRLEPSDPFPIVFPKDEIPVIHEHRPAPPEFPPQFHPCPEQFVPDFAQPVKRKPKNATDEQLYMQCKDLWDALERVLRVLDAAAPPPSPPTADATVARSKPIIDFYDYNDPFDNMVIPYYPPCDPLGSPEERMLIASKEALMGQLYAAERKFGVTQKSKKFGKKAKAKTDNAKFKLFDKKDLMPWAWKALGLLQNFLIVFVMIQLSLVGGDVFNFFKKSPKNSSWLGF